jgi:glycosyl transferase family 61
MTNDVSDRLRKVAQLSGETSIVEVPVRLPRVAELVLGPGLSDIPSFRCPPTTDLVHGYRISDTVVGGAFRLLMKDGFVVQESLFGISNGEIASAATCELLPVPLAKNKIGILGFVWTGTNYYHWLAQVLTSIECCVRNKYAEDVFIVFPELSTLQEKTLRILGYDQFERLVLSRDQQVCIPQLEFSNFIGSTLMLTRIAPCLYKRLKQGVKLKSQKNSRVYVSRQDASFRRVTNESDVVQIMETYGFDIVYPGQLELEEQINCFHNASVVVGLHGAGLTNIVFCNEGTVVYEFMPEQYKSLAFERFAINCGLRYVSDVCTQVVGEKSSQVTDVTVDTAILTRRLTEFGL